MPRPSATTRAIGAGPNAVRRTSVPAGAVPCQVPPRRADLFMAPKPTPRTRPRRRFSARTGFGRYGVRQPREKEFWQVKMLSGFKEFILRGNIVELAVGVVIGVAFN